MKTSILILLALMASSAHAQMMCSDVMKPSVTIAEFETITGHPVQSYIETFTSTIRPEVLAGKEKPTWQDFENLKNLTERIKSLKADLQSKPETALLLESLTADLKEVLLQKPEVQNLLDLHKNKTKEVSYQPTEREIKIAYLHLVRELNQVLPKELRIPVSRPASDNRKATIDKEAEAYMKRLVKDFNRVFENSPHKTYKAFVKFIRESQDPEIQRALKLIDGNQLRVVMRRPENARFWVPKVGFQNQFVTGSSRGSLNPGARNLAERNLYNLETQENYAAHDPEFKPKYGTLSIKPETGLTPDLGSSMHYGPDIYGFKTEKIKDRLTFYTTDSLGPGWNVNGAHTKYTDFFIPWKFRVLLVPFMAANLKNNVFRVGQPPIDIKLEEGPQPYGRFYYWETQILGTVRLEDVASFTFTNPGNPPRGEFLRDLIKHGIEIYDGSAGLGPEQLKKWTPSAEDLAAP